MAKLTRQIHRLSARHPRLLSRARTTQSEGRPDDRYHPASLRDLPYSEKVRLGFGLKRLAWRSVEIPAIMPKPDLTALTGGYRKTPVLQIGADIYCDSQLIMRELERRCPNPTFSPAGHGAADALAWWAE